MVDIIAGEHDHMCRRVNLSTGLVEPYRPDAPPADEWRTWAWDEYAERWQPVDTGAATRRRRVGEIKAQLEAAERAQGRAQRELLLAFAAGMRLLLGREAVPAEALARLAEIEAAAVELRRQLATRTP